MSSKKIIFAVDDEASMGEIYQAILGDTYDLHFFEMGEDLLNLALSMKPHLVIIDTGLADMSGYLLCQELKHKEEMQEVPVVFVTGQDFSEDKGRAFFSGGSEYITKPIKAAPFCALLERLIEDFRSNQLDLD